MFATLVRRGATMALLGAILTTQAAVKHLGEGASIINIGSGVSRLTPAQSTVYTGTKGALDAISITCTISPGTALDATEMRPRPPIAMTATAIGSSPLSSMKSCGTAATMSLIWTRLPEASFTPRT